MIKYFLLFGIVFSLTTGNIMSKEKFSHKAFWIVVPLCNIQQINFSFFKPKKHILSEFLLKDIAIKHTTQLYHILYLDKPMNLYKITIDNKTIPIHFNYITNKNHTCYMGHIYIFKTNQQYKITIKDAYKEALNIINKHFCINKYIYNCTRSK